MKIYTGIESINLEKHLFENGYGKLKPTGIVTLNGDGDSTKLKKLSNSLESKLNIVDAKRRSDKENWDIAINYSDPFMIFINTNKETDEIISIEEKIINELKKLDIGGDNEATISYVFEANDYKTICNDAKKYFDKIVGKKTSFHNTKGTFLECIKPIDEDIEEFEHVFIFKPDCDIKYKDKAIFVRDKSMLINGLINKDI